MDEAAEPLSAGDVGQQGDETTPIVEDDDGVSERGLSETTSEPESDAVVASEADGVANPDARAIVPGPPSEHSATVEAGDTEAFDEIEVETAGTEEPDETAEPESDARLRLRQVIDNFASEHQQEIEARDEFESRNLTSRPAPESDDDTGSDPVADLPSDEHSSAEAVENTSVELVAQGESSNELEAALAGEETRSEAEASGRRGAMSSIASRPTFLRIVRNGEQSEFSGLGAEVQQDVETQRDTDVGTDQQSDAEPLIDTDAQQHAKATPPELIEVPTAIVREPEPAAPDSIESEQQSLEADRDESPPDPDN